MLQDWFDWLTIKEVPLTQAQRNKKDKTLKLGYDYTHVDPSLVLVKNWEPYLEWASKPEERDDDYDWEDPETLEVKPEYRTEWEYIYDRFFEQYMYETYDKQTGQSKLSCEDCPCGQF